MDLDHERRLTAAESLAKANSKRLDEVERRQDTLDELVGSVKVLANKEENVENVVEEIKADVKTLTAKPGKRWESVVEKIIMLVVAAVVGFIVARLGL